MGHAKRRYRRESDWRLLLAEWRRSGLSVQAFCRSHDLSEASFYLWRRKLEPAHRPKPAFLSVNVLPDSTLEPSTLGVEVVLGKGRTLRVRPGFDSHTFIRVVDLLERGGNSC